MKETPSIAACGAKPLQGKTALVTGAAKRIGRQIALELAQAGAHVGITYLSSPAEAEQAVAEMRNLGVRAFAARADLTDAEQIRAGVDTIVRELGGLDLLVNNAGFF